MMYRALRNLAIESEMILAGSLFEYTFKPGVEQVLFDAGAIAEIQPPPLAVLPHWKVRAAKLALAGIVTVDQFLAAEDGQVAEHMGCAPTLVARWKQEVKQALMAAATGG